MWNCPYRWPKWLKVWEDRDTSCMVIILQAVDSAKYLGVNISDDIQWKTHIEFVTAKAPRTICFLRRNLYSCTNEVREATYCGLVRSSLEYFQKALMQSG